MVLPVVVMVYLYGGIQDVAARQGNNRLNIVGLASIGALIIVLTLAHVAKTTGPPTLSWHLRLSATGMFLTLSCSLAVPFISTRVEELNVPSLPAYVALGSALLATCGVGIFSARTR